MFCAQDRGKRKSAEEVEDARFSPPPRACPRVRERGRRGRGKEGTRGSSRDGNNFRRERDRVCMRARARAREREREKKRRERTRERKEERKEKREEKARENSPRDGNYFRRERERDEREESEFSSRRK